MDKNNKFIMFWIGFIPVVAIVITAFFIANIFISQIEDQNENRLAQLEVESYLKVKDTVKFKINSVIRRLDKLSSKEEAQAFLIDSVFGDKGYFFAYTYDGVTISHIKKDLIGKNRFYLKKDGKYILQEIISIGKQQEGGYLEYTATLDPATKMSAKKISYINHYDRFGWIIGTGMYTTQINNNIFKQKEKFNISARKMIQSTVIYVVIFTILIILIMILIHRRLKMVFTNFENSLLDKNNELESKVAVRTKELNNINKTLHEKIKKAVDDNIKKDKMLQEQAKLAAMGEMIGAIAHQWRQPLNALSLGIQNLDDDYEDGLINELFIDKFIYDNQKIIKFMSVTIDDFRNFFRVDKNKEHFSIKDAVSAVINIQTALFVDLNIAVDIKGNDFYIDAYKSEFKQVILNLLNNAKDVLVERDIKDAKIEIILKDNEINICDNAGGVPDNIIQRIFEPYFTTKEQGKGTGIGLYMSKMIIDDSIEGKLSVQNNNNGAVFKIVFKR